MNIIIAFWIEWFEQIHCLCLNQVISIKSKKQYSNASSASES